MTTYPGSCHCGAIQIWFDSARSPPRAAPAAVPASSAAATAHAPMATGPRPRSSSAPRPTHCRRYASASASPTICCAASAALTSARSWRTKAGRSPPSTSTRSISANFDPAPPLHVYDGENEKRRRSRRRKFWMPATRDRLRSAMAILGIIADDFTGATDIAGMLVKGGMRPSRPRRAAEGHDPDDVDAVVVALKTRSIAAKDAIAQSLEALKALQAAGCVRSSSSTARRSTRPTRATSARSATRCSMRWAANRRSTARPSPRTAAPSSSAICSSATCCCPTRTCATIRSIP